MGKMVHVDNAHALESKFPGTGHDLATTFCERVTDSARQNFEGPPRADTPDLADRRMATSICRSQVRKASVPVCKIRLESAKARHCPHTAAKHATEQFHTTKAPPAPEQSKTVMDIPLSTNPVHMSADFELRTDHTKPRASVIHPNRALNNSKASVKSANAISMESLAPPRRPVVYPVLVSSTAQQQGHQQAMSSSKPAKPAPPVGRPPNSARSGRDPAARAPSSRPPYSARVPIIPQRDPEPTVANVCSALSAFDSVTEPVKHIGNYWMEPSRSVKERAIRPPCELTTGAETARAGEGAPASEPAQLAQVAPQQAADAAAAFATANTAT